MSTPETSTPLPPALAEIAEDFAAVTARE